MHNSKKKTENLQKIMNNKGAYEIKIYNIVTHTQSHMHINMAQHVFTIVRITYA